MPRPEMLLPGDLPVALQLGLTPALSFESLSAALGISTSMAHRAVQRLERASLVIVPHRRLAVQTFMDLVGHGLRHVYYAEMGPETLGVPTAHAVGRLAEAIVSDRPYVWPSARGSVRGDSITPLFSGAAELPASNPALYEALALIDAVRVGRVRERRLAVDFLESMLVGTRSADVQS